MSENMQKHQAKKGLGRGLGSLLGQTDDGAFSKTIPEEVANKTLQALTENLPSVVEVSIPRDFIETKAPQVPEQLRIWQIPIEKLTPNPNQPRQIFEPAPLQELADSIKEKGVIQPILVRKLGTDRFEIIAGERRWRAAQLAGLLELPAIVRESADQDVLELALIENIQRANLNPVEEAEAYEFLIQKYAMTQQELAQKMGKDRTSITNILRLLQLQPSVRQMVSRNELSLGHAKVLLSVSEPDLQERLAKKTLKEGLSVRSLEKQIVRDRTEPGPTLDDREALRNKMAANLGEELQKLIGSKVNLDYAQGKGKLAIHFYSDAELNQIADRLRDAWQS